jgi:hypothetical protein
VPVVLVEVGGVARSGHLYGDRTGIEYEYPAGRYEGWIHRGDRFVYQVPRVGYVGVGIIGDTRPSSTVGRLICRVLSVRLFKQPVSLRDHAGTYYEADPTFWKDKVYWGQGVRPLTDQRFDAIVAAAGVSMTADPDPVAPSYADPQAIQKVEQVSVAVAVTAMQERFGTDVEVMPRNNPGFDLRVGPATAPVRYVEVKGTQSAIPSFFMSDGEREFSIRNSSKYTLVVVSGINIEAETHASVSIRDGALEGSDVEMQPSQWRGRLLG